MFPSLTQFYMQTTQMLDCYSIILGNKSMSISFARASWLFPVLLKFAVMDVSPFKNQK